MDKLLDDFAMETSDSDPSYVTRPDECPRPKGWIPPPALRSSLRQELEIPDNEPDDRNSKLNQRYDEEWDKQMAETKRAKSRPQGWMPSEKQIGDKLNAAWKTYSEAKVDEDLFQTARL